MRVSITIPARNEKDSIVKCLDSIVNCNYNKQLLNVYVVDGMSDDGTTNIIKNYCKSHPYIYLLENKQKTTPFALNIGLKNDDSDIKIILGAHAEIDSNYINNCIQAFKIDDKIGCTGGNIENIAENDTSSIISKAMSSGFGVGNAYFRTGSRSGYVDTVAFGAYKKEVFEKIGYFDEELIRNQDDEFNFRLLKAGFKIYLSSSIKAKYYVRASFKKLYRQYYQYGYWKVYVNKKHKTITTNRQIVPFLFVCYLIFGGILAFANSFLLICYVSIFFIYLILAYYNGLKKSSSLIDSLKITYTFLILHLSYGTGYLNGLIRFYIFRKKPTSASTKLTR